MISLHTLRTTMRNCKQTNTQNVLQHGLSVHHHYLDLFHHIILGGGIREGWQLPEWIKSNVLWEQLRHISPTDIRMYHIYHDCGKPSCVELDSEGRSHFINHALVSSNIWAQYGGNDVVGQLIANDMAAHITKPANWQQFKLLPNWQLLLITALCELHSNSKMFGGVQSTSFKIKYKQLVKLGNRCIDNIGDIV